MQGYLNRDLKRTVRVRIDGNSAWVTIKGETISISRAEYEYEVPIADAKEMILLCEGSLVEKWRWVVQSDGLNWEVDEFLGDNSGLIVAEIELQKVDQVINYPNWI